MLHSSINQNFKENHMQNKNANIFCALTLFAILISGCTNIYNSNGKDSKKACLPGHAWQTAEQLPATLTTDPQDEAVNVDGEIPNNLTGFWYTFSLENNDECTLWGFDRQIAPLSFSADIAANLYKMSASGKLVFVEIGGVRQEKIDIGTLDLGIGFSSDGGTYYLQVKPKDNLSENKGTFKLQLIKNDTRTEPGISSATAIILPLSNDAHNLNWTEGIIASNQNALWYKFTRTGNAALFGVDKNEENTGYNPGCTADIVIDIFSGALFALEDQDGPLLNKDFGVSFGEDRGTISAIWDGTYYIRVRPKNNTENNKGSFRIAIAAF